MKLKQLFAFILLGFPFVGLSQGFNMHLSNSFADCYGAVEVLDYSKPSRVQFPGNYGRRDDFINLFPDFHEVNSVWLRLAPNLKGTFEFEIATEQNIDFSFLLFKVTENNFCEKLENAKVEPVLADLSPSFDAKGIETEPRNENFKPSIETDFHDVFYLMIHTNSTYRGKVTVTYNRKGEIGVTQSVVQDFRKSEDDPYIRVRIRDKETMQPVEANLIVEGLGKDNALFMGTDFIFSARRARELHLESTTPGYFMFVKDVELDRKSNDNAEILIEMEKLAPGKKLKLPEIKFHQDSDDFLPIAMPVLKRLLDFLAVNESVNIEIQGHVNAPGKDNSKKIQRLSEQRAKAVMKYLKDNGIDPDRMTAVGFGNTEMLYEKPKTPQQEEANRRVEVLIVD